MEEDYTERECVMIGRCDVLSGGPFQRKIPNGLGIIKPPGPDATNAMGTLPLTTAQRRPRMAAVRRRTVRCGLRLFISSRRPGGRFAAGPPRATVPAPLFGGHDGPGASWPEEWAGPRAGQQGDLAEICVTSYVTGP